MVPAAAPAPAGINGGGQPLQAALGPGAFDLIEIAISQEHLGGAVDRVLLAGEIRVAEPARPPASIGPLLGGEVIHAVAYGLVDRTIGNPILPRPQGPQGMAVRSAPLPSSNARPRDQSPRRLKVGQPPSSFCTARSQWMPAVAAVSIRGRWAPAPDFKSTDKAKSAVEVSSRRPANPGRRCSPIRPAESRSAGPIRCAGSPTANRDNPGRPRRRWPTPGR